MHSLSHNLQDHLCSWSRQVSRVTFCQLPESCCFWSLSLADVMWFFLPAHSPASANLGHPALISLAALPLGEKHLVLPQAAVISWQPRLPRHLSVSFSVRFKALTSFHRHTGRSCLLIAIDQKVLNVSIKIEWKRAEKIWHLWRQPISCWADGFPYASWPCLISGHVISHQHYEYSNWWQHLSPLPCSSRLFSLL